MSMRVNRQNKNTYYLLIAKRVYRQNNIKFDWFAISVLIKVDC